MFAKLFESNSGRQYVVMLNLNDDSSETPYATVRVYCVPHNDGALCTRGWYYNRRDQKEAKEKFASITLADCIAAERVLQEDTF